MITMGSQDLVIGARFTIWLEVATVPIMLTDARLVKVTVAVEKHMPYSPAFELSMKQPDLVVPVLCASSPVHRHDVLPILILIPVGYLIYTRRVDLIIFTVYKPLFAFPGAPLYDYQKIAPKILIGFDPGTCGAHDAMVTAG